MDHSIGYTPYSLVLNSTVLPPAAFGKPAVIAIRTDASYGSGHWYEGGGAYPILLVGYRSARSSHDVGACTLPNGCLCTPPSCLSGAAVLYVVLKSTWYCCRPTMGCEPG